MTFRIMSYHINGARDVRGVVAPELSAEIIRAQQPDLVLLQDIGSAIGTGSINQLAEKTGLQAFGPDAEGSCAFLTRDSISNIQSIPLGYGCRCVRADFDRNGERVHLFNLTLSINLLYRNEQVRTLLSDQLVNNPSLPCPAIIAGDFGLPFWGEGIFQINDQLKRSRFPIWRATYPSRAPLWGRDRVYFKGAIRALAGNIVMTTESRHASTHLPLVLTVETRDTREILKLKKRSRISAKQPNPVCG